jgi:hypothetical protein
MICRVPSPASGTVSSAYSVARRRNFAAIVRLGQRTLSMFIVAVVLGQNEEGESEAERTVGHKFDTLICSCPRHSLSNLSRL